MLSPTDVDLLRRVLRLAHRGRGFVEPNPMVACVIAKGDRVIAEGYHASFGGPHAEPTALAVLTESPRGATAYVTLEPCCHTNKKTPPCAPRLVEAGIARVVIGCLDPNPDVNGKGVALLRAAGVTVDLAPEPLAAEFRQLIAPFTLGQTLGRPYLTLKWAETADGFVGGPGRSPLRITGPESDAVVQSFRGRCHGIAVGVGTVVSDDPLLTARGDGAIHRPTRFVFDRQLRLPTTARMLHDGGPTVEVFTTLDAPATYPDRYAALNRAGVRVTACRVADPEDYANAMRLAGMTGRHVLIEPGPTLAAAFLPAADRLWVFSSTKPLVNAENAPKAAAVPSYYAQTGRRRFGDDTLTEYLNTRSPAFAAAVPSADFLL